MFAFPLLTFFGLCSCVTFNTGAKPDNRGKAVPTCESSLDNRYFKLNGVAYQEIKVEYRQLNPKWVGVFRLPHYIDTFNDDTPPAESIGAPAAERYPVRVDTHRTDAPAFIKAADFNEAAAERVEKRDLPTIRTTGNQMRRPLAVLLSYGVDLSLTAASYTVGSVLAITLLPFDGGGML